MTETPDIQSILKLRVPIIVRLGQRMMPLREVLDFGPGALIELPKHFEEELDILVNNKPIGTGTAVKVGENFGLQVTTVHDPEERIKALGPDDES